MHTNVRYKSRFNGFELKFFSKKISWFCLATSIPVLENIKSTCLICNNSRNSGFHLSNGPHPRSTILNGLDIFHRCINFNAGPIESNDVVEYLDGSNSIAYVLCFVLLRMGKKP
ncbi:hypothetical protein DERP_008694 [Dermatophagoides pteronyssinus]|uniref:Uncharacterized protein n=1 Tax=Dermatophagoides pteronyssinus TaxID=6956 RepID=A0ABQ8IW11_DERPT|nr:hypothetical protein DERP_008694 [Dermatophagoides pteronyssinus]